ncbi:hypothetical protein BU23DRAFT_575436 [Bimuria novae-zelandiae CBS 107.79]|uniref:GPI anchored serine-threonine rich protein n=1 Tax=Bimuria novae-zelandiae CBS 107.79 TaxID=1447943 RepID=A0A6A5ULI6_9PLEO|nr:hypothetical protein BU23DRAFT_575436 [Bimuria novae-zelandiae CBS 107.79]
MHSTIIIALLSIALPSVHALLGLSPFQRRDLCSDNGYEACDDDCMVSGSVCCNTGDATYCPAGFVCFNDGCCPEGEQCTGNAGGTQWVSLDIPESTRTVRITTTRPAPTTEQDISSTKGPNTSMLVEQDPSTPKDSSVAQATTSAASTEVATSETTVTRATTAQNTSSETSSETGSGAATGSTPEHTGGAPGLGYAAGFLGLAFVAGQLVLAL